VSARVDPDGGMLALGLAATVTPAPEALAPLAIDHDERYDGPALPGDHPAWMRDAVSISQRARALLAVLKPVVIHVIGVWEHRVRSIVVGGRSMNVDASGSYRID
jgi:hypothetical protein